MYHLKHPVWCLIRRSCKLLAACVQVMAPVLQEHPEFEFPVGCPFNWHKDLYGPRNAAMERSKGRTWRCTLCSKIFHTENYLAEHMDRQHADQLPPVWYCHQAEQCSDSFGQGRETDVNYRSLTC